ncbi:SDR family NAD(P)-dependent oxidoreductase [Phenylobacterium sp.]|uniref:SDR family NAD(P)-dependent oxidoreductase n=1 Tax=Phenylobacterium sp. TaxID=1871053 RepID=UPI0027343C5D|nr:SDR family NAD(P)-dependent oxidoreductase [Phenylobacterium sp.]MDP3659696.1 SDR family NAD(P)-dependent oxidoreductase [Phenylobacterium sp.]
MPQPFGFNSTTEDVLEGVDLKGKRILITGASAGLGVETARALASRGADLVCAARDLDKARRALAETFEQAADGVQIELIELDLASLASVRKAADALNTKGATFDVVIANAGVMACPEGRTSDGFETQFGTNHLGHFVFVNRIAPLIKDGGRVVIVSSGAHHRGDVDLDDPNFDKTPYEPYFAYGRSKTANTLYGVALDSRLRGRGVRVVSLSPGLVPTELGRHRAGAPAGASPAPSVPPLLPKTLQQGAATSVWAAVVPASDLIGGQYCEDVQVAPINTDLATRGGVRPYAIDPARAEALWRKSEDMVGERFDL